MDHSNSPRFHHIILFLSLLLLALVLLLIFMYRKLKKESDGEYAIRHLMYKDGGVRDRVRGAALGLGTRLGVRLWPGGDAEDGREEMREIRVEEGGSHEGDDDEDYSEDDADVEKGQVEQCEASVGKGDEASNDASSEASGPTDQPQADAETEASVERAGEGGDGGEVLGGAGLLIDLKPFSGNATWSSEKGVEVVESDVTLL